MRLVVSILITSSAIACGSGLFNAPADWVDLEMINPNPEEVSRIEGFSSPEGAIRVILTELADPIRLERGADAMMRGQLKSLEGSGFRHEFTKPAEIRGYQARHQRGEMPRPDEGTALALDSYALFTDDGVLSISIVTDPASASRAKGMEYLQLVNIQGGPIDLKTANIGPPGDSPEERIGYLLGQITGFLFIGVLAVLGVRALVRKAKRDRAQITDLKQGEDSGRGEG